MKAEDITDISLLAKPDSYRGIAESSKSARYSIDSIISGVTSEDRALAINSNIVALSNLKLPKSSKYLPLICSKPISLNNCSEESAMFFIRFLTILSRICLPVSPVTNVLFKSKLLKTILEIWTPNLLTVSTIWSLTSNWRYKLRISNNWEFWIRSTEVIFWEREPSASWILSTLVIPVFWAPNVLIWSIGELGSFIISARRSNSVFLINWGFKTTSAFLTWIGTNFLRSGLNSYL